MKEMAILNEKEQKRLVVLNQDELVLKGNGTELSLYLWLNVGYRSLVGAVQQFVKWCLWFHALGFFVEFDSYCYFYSLLSRDFTS